MISHLKRTMITAGIFALQIAFSTVVYAQACTAPPTCGPNEALKYNGSALVCVTPTVTVTSYSASRNGAGGGYIVNCPAGTIRTGGGCECQTGDAQVAENFPIGANGWRCECEDTESDSDRNATAYVLCLRLN